MKKTRTLYPENITKTFRRFSGTISLQIDGGRWIELEKSTQADQMLLARNMDQLISVTIDEDLNIVELKIDKYKNANKKLAKQIKDFYTHGKIYN